MNKTKYGIYLSALLGLSMILMFAWSAAAAADVPRMSADELKGLLNSPDVIILDVRTASDFNNSDQKITGALRESKSDFKNWADKYPKEGTLVLYCA